MNFTPIFREEVLFGGYNETNKSSTGLIQLLQEKLIDFSISNIALNQDRSKVVDIAIIDIKGDKVWTLNDVTSMLTFS